MNTNKWERWERIYDVHYTRAHTIWPSPPPPRPMQQKDTAYHTGAPYDSGASTLRPQPYYTLSEYGTPCAGVYGRDGRDHVWSVTLRTVRISDRARAVRLGSKIELKITEPILDWFKKVNKKNQTFGRICWRMFFLKQFILSDELDILEFQIRAKENSKQYAFCKNLIKIRKNTRRIRFRSAVLQ